MPGKVLPILRAASSSRCLLAPLFVTIAIVTSACGGSGDTDSAANSERHAELRTLSAAYSADTADTLRNDTDAMAVAGELFGLHCASCHGVDGQGSRGITDLTSGRFGYGTSVDAIRTTIRDGRQSEMPGMGRQFGEVELGQIVAYIETLATDAELNDYESRGQEFYAESCASCHGENGYGIPALGAPDLTDDYWLHGDSMMQVRLAITRGVTAACPPQGDALSPAEIELLTAWVLDRSGA